MQTHQNNRKWLILLLFFLCSCAATVREQETSNIASDVPGENEKRLTEELGKNTLQEEDLQIMETRALEKVMEFYELVDVIEENASNTTFIQISKNQLSSLFPDNDKHILLQQDTLNVDQFIELLRNPHGKLMQPADCQINAGFETDNDNYKATITCVSQNNEMSNIPCTLKKIEKSFGKQTKEVWEVYLLYLPVQTTDTH